MFKWSNSQVQGHGILFNKTASLPGLPRSRCLCVEVKGQLSSPTAGSRHGTQARTLYLPSLSPPHYQLISLTFQGLHRFNYTDMGQNENVYETLSSWTRHPTHAVFSRQPVCVLRGRGVRAGLVALCPSTPAFFAHADAY